MRRLLKESQVEELALLPIHAAITGHLPLHSSAKKDLKLDNNNIYNSAGSHVVY